MKKLSCKQKEQLLKISENIQGTIAHPVTGEGEESIAFVTLVRICRDYAVRGAWAGGYKNKDMLLSRLEKFRIRFYENI